MSAETKYFKLGMFVLVSVFVAVGAIVVFGAGTFMRKKVMAETYVDESVQGLDVGAAVKFRGVHVGQLEKIDFAAVRYGVRDSRIPLFCWLKLPLSLPHNALASCFQATCIRFCMSR